MAINFYPRAGQILVCDLREFDAPEMNKVRPVMVISPRLKYRGEIVAFVPISTTSPNYEQPFAVKLSKNYHPLEADDKPCWAKCDMILNLNRSRLDGFKVGRRKYELPQATGADLEAVKLGVLYGLGMQSLIPSA